MSESHAKACFAGAAALNRYRPGSKAAGLLMELNRRLSAPKRETAKPPKSDFATLKEQLSANAMTALSNAQLRCADGQITERELWCVIDAIYDTIVPIVGFDIADIVYAARQELQEHAPQ